MININNFVQHELITKLPPVRSEEEYFADFEKIPYLNPLDRQKNAAERAILVSGLSDFRISRAFGYRVDFQVAEAIRRGYRLSVKNDGRNGDYKNSTFYNKKEGDTTAFVLVGPSGVGKTTALNSSLDYYDQVISHEGVNYRMKQIVYIKVECPPGGSMKTFYDSCLEQMELALNYEIPDKKYAQTVDKKLALFKNCAFRWNLGLLVIDEIQNLTVFKNRDVLMNQFLNLSNILRVPIVYVGTNKVREYFKTGEFYTKRRLGIEINADAFKKDSLWDNLMRRLWEYQWLQEYVPLTDELSDVFYAETGGIINRVISLFENAQREAILNGHDTISGFTPEFIVYVSKQYFSMSRESLNALAATDASGLNIKEEEIKQMAVASNSFVQKTLMLKKEYNENEQFLGNKENSSEQMDALRNSVLTNVLSWNKFAPEPFEKNEINKAIKQIFRKKSLLKNGEEDVTKKVIRLLQEERNSTNMQQITIDDMGKISVADINADSFPRYRGVL